MPAPCSSSSSSSRVRIGCLADLDSIESWLQSIPDQGWGRSDLQQSLCAEDRLLLVSVNAATKTDRESIQGFAMLQCVLDEATLLYLAVDPGCRRKGIACALLQQLQAQCVGRGCERIVLEVRESNAAARALYLRCGFQLVGQRRNYYPAKAIQASRENAMVLAWRYSA